MKLTIGHIIRAAYETVGQNRRLFLVMAAVFAVIASIAVKAASAIITALAGGRFDLAWVDSVVWIVLSAVLTAGFEVHWLRVLLLGEAHDRRAYFRLRGRELRYAALGMLLSALVAGPYHAGDYLQQHLTSGETSIENLMTIAYQFYVVETIASIVVSALLASVFAPWLAAIAVGRSPQGIAEILHLTRGNRLRIATIFLLGFEPLKLVLIVMELSAGGAIGGLNLWGIIYSACLTWILFCYLAISAEIYWELDHAHAIRNLRAVFD
jgi:hypothetical protein